MCLMGHPTAETEEVEEMSGFKQYKGIHHYIN